MIIENEFDGSGAVAQSQYALDGSTVVWETSSFRGTSLDLVGGDDFGWLTRAQVLSLIGMSGIPKWVGSLVYEGITYRVRFRNEEPPAVEARPLIPRPNHVTTDYYVVRVKLMTI